MKFTHGSSQFYHIPNNAPKTSPTSKTPTYQKKSTEVLLNHVKNQKNQKFARKRESMADIMLSNAIQEITTDMKLISAAKDKYYKNTVENLKEKLKERMQNKQISLENSVEKQDKMKERKQKKQISQENSIDILKNQKYIESKTPFVAKPDLSKDLPPLYEQVTSIDPKVTSPDDIKGMLKNLSKGNNLEDWLEKQGVKQGVVDIPSIRSQLEVVINDDEDLTKIMPIQKELAPRWQRQVDQLKELNEGENLDKWLKEINLPHNVSVPEIKAKLKQYFMHETFETFQGRSMVYTEDSIAKKMWDEFIKMHPAKQAAVVIGATVITAVVGFLSWELYMLAWPGVLAVNPYFVEVGAQIFIQRQEGAFHLLLDQAERSKPLSTAWANQYILWKYI